MIIAGSYPSDTVITVPAGELQQGDCATQILKRERKRPSGVGSTGRSRWIAAALQTFGKAPPPVHTGRRKPIEVLTIRKGFANAAREHYPVRPVP
jgi:hypothetical protein